MKKRKTWAFIGLLLLTLILGGGGLLTKGAVTAQAAKRTTGIYTIQNQKYYYVNGKRLTGWHKISGSWYYFQPKKKGAMATGFLMIGEKKFAFAKSGKKFTGGFHKIGGKWYAVTAKGNVRTGWYFTGDKKYYYKKSGTNMGAAAVGTYTMGTPAYKNTFNEKGQLIKSVKVTSATANQLQKSTGSKTIRNYLLEAMRGMGTKYQLGGWGNTTTKDIPSTMDCSGFVGWASYQFFNAEKPGGCVVKSYNIPDTYAAWGWGSVRDHSTLASNSFKGQFKSGDIVRIMHDPAHPNTSTGHVWIVVGQCSDGSYVLVHCSPPCVQIAGTPTPDNKVGEAIQLATTYMQKYFPEANASYNLDTAGGPYGTHATDLNNYLTQSSIQSFRWNTKTLSDPEKLKSKNAAAILKDLFGES